jgi:PEP-CTERM motif
MRTITSCALFFCVLSSVCRSGYTAEIEFVETGIGSGSIGTTSFSNSTFTITSFADTTNRLLDTSTSAFVYSIDHDSSEIAINGVGTFQFLSKTRTYVNNTKSTVGFSRGPSGSLSALDLYNGLTNPAFGTWDMLSSIGPITGTTKLLQWNDFESAVQTNAGQLIFNSANNISGSFSATIVPEPSTLTLLALGVVGLVVARWRARC